MVLLLTDRCACSKTSHLLFYWSFFILCIIMYILCLWHISSLQPFSLWKGLIKRVIYWLVNDMWLPILWDIPHPFIWRNHCWWSTRLNLRLSGQFKWIHHSVWWIHLVFSFINNLDSRIQAKAGNTMLIQGSITCKGHMGTQKPDDWKHSSQMQPFCSNLLLHHTHFFIYIIYIFW